MHDDSSRKQCGLNRGLGLKHAQSRAIHYRSIQGLPLRRHRFRRGDQAIGRYMVSALALYVLELSHQAIGLLP